MVPKHLILSDKEAESLLEQFKVTRDELPKIKISDPAIVNLKPKLGDIVRIEKESIFKDPINYYRVVV
jgi:DNA-directed RNA polymerase subunit H